MRRPRHFPAQLPPAARLNFAQAAQMSAQKRGIAREPLGLKTAFEFRQPQTPGPSTVLDDGRRNELIGYERAQFSIPG